MPLDDDDAAYESLIKSQMAPKPRPAPAIGHLPELTGFAQEQGLTVGSTTNGRHNPGSKHYIGDAIDIKNSGRFTNEQVQSLKATAAERGLKVRDERTRPPGQAVWGGPHIHLEYAGQAQDPYESLIKKQTAPTQQVAPSVDPYEALINQQTAPVVESSTITPSVAKPPIKTLAGTTTRPMVRRGGDELAYQLGLPQGHSRPLAPSAAPPQTMDTVRQGLGLQPNATRELGERAAAETAAKAPLRQSIGLQVTKERNPSTFREGLARGPEAIAEKLNPFNWGKSESEKVNEEVERRVAATERAQSPEMIERRKGRGAMSAAARAIDDPSARALAGGMHAAAGVADLFGLLRKVDPEGSERDSGWTPLGISNYLHKRAQVLEESTTNAPLTPEGQEIERGFKEKLGASVGDLGLGIAQIIALKKATGLPLGRLLAIETGLKTSNESMAERAPKVAESYVLGRALEGHLGRLQSAGLFAAPTAVGVAPSVLRGTMPLSDAALQVGVQAAAGGILGGKGRTATESRAASGGTSTEVGSQSLMPDAPAVEPVHHSQVQTREAGQFGPIDPAKLVPTGETRLPVEGEWFIDNSGGRKQAKQDYRQGEYQILGRPTVEPQNVQENVRPKLDEQTTSAIPVPKNVQDNAPGIDQPNGLRQYNINGKLFTENPDQSGAVGNVIHVTAEDGTKGWVRPTETPISTVPRPENYPNVPEKPETIQAQMDARGFALVPEGTEGPPIPEGYLTEPTPDGTVYYDPARIDVETIRNTPTQELLGHVEEKSPATTEAVVARDANGNEIHSSAVSPENVEAQVAQTQQNFPEAEVESGGPELAQEVLDERATGIKHAVVEAERELAGLPQFAKARRAHGQSFDEGIADVKSGRIDPRKLASDIVRAFYDRSFSMERFNSRRPRPLSTEESMALLYDRMRISQERKAAETELEAAQKSGDDARMAKAVDKVSELQKASNDNDEADYVSGGENARGLAIRRELIKDDYSRARVLSKAVAINKGKPLPPEVQAKYEEIVEQLSQAHKRIADLEEQRATKTVESEVERVIRREKSDLRSKNRQRSREVLKTERADIKQQIALAWAKQKALIGKEGTLSQGGLGKLDPEGELTKAIGKLARNYVEEGITKASDLVDAVHEHIKDVTDLTKRQVQDLISGYGRIAHPSADEVSRKLNEAKSLMRIMSGKADVVERGMRPLKRGGGNKPSQTVQDALRDLRATMKEHGIELDERTPAEKVLAAQKAFMTRMKQKTADLQKDLLRAQRGDPKEVKQKREPLPLTDEMKVAQRNANMLRRQIDDLDAITEWVNLSKTQKALAYTAAGVRASVLSGVKVLGKIGGALTHRIPQQYLEEIAGQGWKRVFPDVASKAPRHGGNVSAASEAAFGRGVVEGVKEIPSIIKTGDSEISLEHGKRYPTIPTKLGRALSVPGRIHAAEKNPLKTGEYRRSLEMRLDAAERKVPGSRTNPDIVEQAKKDAYRDAEEVVLLGDNAFSRSLTNMQRNWTPESKSLMKVVVPVAKVPSNYLSHAVGEYGFGILRGTVRALKARNPELLEKMTPEEADKTMRLLKRGTLGAVAQALVGAGLITAGGFYSGKRKEGDIDAGDVKIGNITIPHQFMHTPPAEMAQFVAQIKRDIAAAQEAKKSKSMGALKGAAMGTLGLAEQTPFLSQYTRLVNRDNYRSGEAVMKTIADQLASRVEPQLMKEFAQVIDREDKGEATRNPLRGEPVKRKSAGFTDKMKEGIPLVRESLPINNILGNKPSRATHEVQRLGVDMKGAVKQPDETPERFAQREKIQNELTKQYIESVVADPKYAKETDENKLEWLKQAKERAAADARDRLPEMPEKKEKKEFPIPSGRPISMVPRGLRTRSPFKERFAQRSA